MLSSLCAVLLLALLPTTLSFVVPSSRSSSVPFVTNCRSTLEVCTTTTTLYQSSEADTEAEVSTEEKTTTATAETEEEEEDAAEPDKSVRHTLFVGNIPFDTPESELQNLFSQHGTVQSISLPMRDGQPRGFAFIDMSTEEELYATIDALDGEMLSGRQLKVVKSVPKDQLSNDRPRKEFNVNRNADGRKLYIGNLPFDVVVEEVKEFFEDFDCTVSDVYLPFRDGRARGFAFVTVTDESVVPRVIDETNGIDFGGRRLTVSVPLPPGEKMERQRTNNSNRVKIYVGNLSFYTVPETLKEIFEEFGSVLDCYMPEDDEGSRRGFGFITMERDSAQAAIMELDGCEVDGRNIRVNEAQPKA